MSQVLAETYLFLKGFWRYRETLFWVVVFPALLVALFILIFGSPERSISLNVAAVDLDGGPLASALLKALNSTGVAKVRLAQAGDAARLVANGTYDAVLVVPAGFTENLTQARRAVAYLYYYADPNWGGVARGVVYGVVEEFSASVAKYAVNFTPAPFRPYVEFVAQPISLREAPVEPKLGPGGLALFHVVSVIGVQTLFIGLFTGINIVIERRRDRTLALLLSSPMKSYHIFLGDTLAAAVAVGISAAAVLAVGYTLGADYGAISPGQAAAAALLLAAGLLSTIGIGLLLAPLARTPEAAAAMANGVAFPLMFLGGLAVPQWMIPEWLRIVPMALPLSWCLNGVRAMFLYGYGPLEALSQAAPGAAAGLALYAVGAFVYRRLLHRAQESP